MWVAKEGTKSAIPSCLYLIDPWLTSIVVDLITNLCIYARQAVGRAWPMRKMIEDKINGRGRGTPLRKNGKGCSSVESDIRDGGRSRRTDVKCR